ncbi:DUF4238 domain-containing protein [Clostridium sp. AF21-20LB]|nr:DUF4238 domain-containing protein [Clostridium sp. AF21-20LB]
MTKNQHYIPQVYLRGFSPEYEKGSKSYPNSRYTIYCYDLNVKKQKYESVPIKSICYIKYLYEVTGHSGEIVLPNYLEHFFAGIEKMFSDFRSGLERKAFIEDNYRTNCFLTNISLLVLKRCLAILGVVWKEKHSLRIIIGQIVFLQMMKRCFG